MRFTSLLGGATVLHLMQTNHQKYSPLNCCPHIMICLMKCCFRAFVLLTLYEREKIISLYGMSVVVHRSV